MLKRAGAWVLATVMILVASSGAFSRQNPNKNSSGTGQMKEGTKEMGKAGKSLGHNVKHGRVVRGGKHFGKHVGRGSKRIAVGTKKVVKKAVKP